MYWNWTIGLPKKREVMAKLESTGYLVDTRDAFIGAIAIENGYSVLTANGKRFERIPDLLVLDPSEITL
jgi:predicted nucleic acid-binding protein